MEPKMRSPAYPPKAVFYSWVLLLALSSPAASAAPAVSGSYRVVDTADLGTDVRVTLSIRLTNPSDNVLLISKVGLLGLAPAAHATEEVPVSVNIEPNSSSSFTQDFTIPKAAYELMGKGVRPRLILQVQSAGGAETKLVISLTPAFGGRSHLP
jgi:hypothetical protein